MLIKTQILNLEFEERFLMTVTVFAFVFITSALLLTAVPISRYIAFNVRLSPIQYANA